MTMLSRVACRRDATRAQSRLGRKGLLLVSATRRRHSKIALSTKLSAAPASPQEWPHGPRFTYSRNLATTADPTNVDQDSFSNPFTESPYAVTSSRQYNIRPSTLPGSSDRFDPLSVIIIQEHPETKPKVAANLQPGGLGRNEEEMMANLDMALRVGRFDRAAILISRIGQFYPTGSPEYLVIHNRLLEAMVLHMIGTRQHQMIPSLQRWFDFDMPNEGVHPDASTCAIMIKMALRMMHGPKRDRAVRRYWGLAKDQDGEGDVLSHSILGELELGELSEV